MFGSEDFLMDDFYGKLPEGKPLRNSVLSRVAEEFEDLLFWCFIIFSNYSVLFNVLDIFSLFHFITPNRLAKKFWVNNKTLPAWECGKMGVKNNSKLRAGIIILSKGQMGKIRKQPRRSTKKTRIPSLRNPFREQTPLLP